MPRWRAAGGVVGGAAVTAVMLGVTLLSLPILALVAAAVLGNWLPVWVFALPPVLAVGLGGAVSATLVGGEGGRPAVLGTLGAALGVAVVGVLVGLVALVVVAGFVPASGQPVDLSAGAVPFGSLGAAAGLLFGVAVGGAGAVAGQWSRGRLRT